ncbi:MULTISPECIES: hypothetical protein [unclassified Vibrio]|uniref:hypothetical protein n=1 Tax=unclassified Vibrio TaxID=2614977 RepID=UPI001110CD30|nr:hypothetical protein [Vibrio sp. Hep-1b-8]TMX44999.1 hypothetical protein DA100_04855 [Vibrio sp. Hep-1b-8]
MAWYELLAASLGLIFGTYALVWSIPAVIMIAVVSLGSFKHIIFIDKQLAKDLNKYYDDNGYMRPKHQASWDVGSRFINYCIAYPFIRHREQTDSKKFKGFMWINALGMWSYIVLALSLTLLKFTGYIP